MGIWGKRHLLEGHIDEDAGMAVVPNWLHIQQEWKQEADKYGQVLYGDAQRALVSEHNPKWTVTILAGHQGCHDGAEHDGRWSQYGWCHHVVPKRLHSKNPILGHILRHANNPKTQQLLSYSTTHVPWCQIRKTHQSFHLFIYLLIFQSTIRKKKWEKRLGLPPSWHWPRSGGWRHWRRWQFCWGGWGWKRGARCGKRPWGGGRLEPRYNQGFVSPYSTELLQSPSATQVIMRMERERVNGEGEKRKGGLLKRVKASGNYSRRQ